MNILIFNGGRGATSIIKNLKKINKIKITSVVNAYDDGKSTGEIRKYFEMLGPSDIRKVQSILLDDKNKNYKDFFNYRFEKDITYKKAINFLVNFEKILISKFNFNEKLIKELIFFKDSFLNNIYNKKSLFKSDFNFSDCSLINCLYAGSYIVNNRDLLKTINNFKDLFQIKHDVLPNSIDNLNMIALRNDGHVLYSESEIVNLRSNVILHSIFLIDHKKKLDKEKINNLNFEEKLNYFKKINIIPNLNKDLIDKIKLANVIIFSPGTQHSSLLPSYTTNNIGHIIASNRKALKVFITNIGADYENPVYIASDYVVNAVKYLDQSTKIKSDENKYINLIIVNHNNKIDSNKVHFDKENFKKFNIKFIAKDFEDKLLKGNHDGELITKTIIAEYNLKH